MKVASRETIKGSAEGSVTAPRPLGPDSGFTPTENTSLSFPKFLVNSSGYYPRLMSFWSLLGHEEPCPKFSTKHLINGYMRIQEQHKEKYFLANKNLTIFVSI